MKTLAVAALPLFALAGLSTPAAAGPVKVPYADLNLYTAADQAALHDRVKIAARRSCADVIDMRDLRGQAECQRIAVTEAEPAVLLAIRNAGSDRLAQRSAF